MDNVMDFCWFLFFFVSIGFGWKRESKYGFVREKSWREKWVKGLECWAERRWSSNSNGASVRNPEKLKTSTEASIYIQNPCEQNLEQPIFKPPPLSPSVFKPLRCLCRCHHLAEKARSRGRDRGLERFDGDCGIAQREEKRNFFFFFL